MKIMLEDYMKMFMEEKLIALMSVTGLKAI